MHTNPRVAFMSNLVDRQVQATKKARLRLQRESLSLMLASHMDWMQSTIGSDAHPIHQDLAELIQKAVSQYGMLLDTLQAPETEQAKDLTESLS